MSVTLRDIRCGEEGAVFALVQQVLRLYGLETDPETTDKDLSDVLANYIDRGGCFKVLDDDGAIVGSYGLYPLTPDCCELRKMYLLPEYQGKGLGRRMLDDALETARKKGFKEMVLETNHVLDKASRLYRNYGFEEYTPPHLSSRCDCAMRLEL